MARLMFGELADETILRSIRAVPGRLLEEGFSFQQAEVSVALEDALNS